MNGQYYANLLQKLNHAICDKRPEMAKKKVFFHQDNALVHISTVAMAKIHDLKFELVPHAPYSPDFQLFPNLKKNIGFNEIFFK